MSGINHTTVFLVIWIGFIVLMMSVIVILLLWAIRTRQFENQDRARYLPLRSGIPADHDEHEDAS